MILVFWQNILSPHQAPFLRALADMGHEVTVVSAESLTADRLALGWVAPDMGSARVIIAPTDGEVRGLIENSQRAAIHIMAGARWKPLGNLATEHCLKHGRRTGILTEAPDPRGIAGYGRRAKYTFECFTKGSHYDFVLAMGEMGVRWFRRCGYAEPKVFPFAYVTEPVVLNGEGDLSDKTNLLFAGRFVALKGLDVLLRAMSTISTNRPTLKLLGDGPEKAKLERLVLDLGLNSCITWLPHTDASGVQREMRQADLTLLPSRKDGWGAVVNESLMVGTPVICSTACGAAELIRQPWLGSVFAAGSVEDLAKALKIWIDRGPRTPAERERIRNWSACISGESVARYLTAILDHVYAKAARPDAPWRCANL